MVIELITGHVFAQGSVTAVTPIRRESLKRNGRQWCFTVVGIGFAVDIYPSDALEQPASTLFSKLVDGFIRPEDYHEAEWYLSHLRDYTENWNIDRPLSERERFQRFADKYFGGGKGTTHLAQYTRDDAVSKLLGSTPERPSDTALLDFLDKRIERVTEGQTITDPHGDHVANRWVVEQQASNLRDAIHQLMKGHEFSKDPA